MLFLEKYLCFGVVLGIRGCICCASMGPAVCMCEFPLPAIVHWTAKVLVSAHPSKDFYCLVPHFFQRLTPGWTLQYSQGEIKISRYMI